MSEERYCESHRRNARERDRFRDSAAERGYDARWHAFAREYKRRHPLCAVCELEGRVTPTYCPHHLDPVSTGGDVFVCDEDLLPVCTGCHGRVEGLGRHWQKAVRSINGA